MVLHPPIDTNEICAGARRFGTFRSGFRPPLSDELGNQIAIFRDVAGDNALRLSLSARVFRFMTIHK